MDENGQVPTTPGAAARATPKTVFKKPQPKKTVRRKKKVSSDEDSDSEQKNIRKRAQRMRGRRQTYDDSESD